MRRDGRVAHLLQFIKRAVDADENPGTIGFDRARGRQGVLLVQGRENILRIDPQRGQALVRELDIDALGLLADDIDFLHAGHMQQALAQRLGVAHQFALRLAPGLEGIQRKGHVGVFVVHHRPEHTCGKIAGLIAQLLARLVELSLHLLRRGRVQQRERGERQTRAHKGFRALVPTQLLQALFQFLGDLVLHLAGRGTGPGRDDGHHLDGEGRIFRAAELQERNHACKRDQNDHEERDGALTHGQCREVEAALTHARLLGKRSRQPPGRPLAPGCLRSTDGRRARRFSRLA